MIRCVITAPQEVITGAFNIRFAFSDVVDLTADNIRIETLSGDPLGDPRDNLKGKANHYMYQCYIPTAKYGKSRVSLAVPGVSAEPVEIEYDTVKVVRATWGTPVVIPQKVEIPVSFDYPLRHLRKRNFRVSPALPFQLYLVGEGYQIVIRKRVEGRLSVGVRGSVTKASGIEAYIEESGLEV